MITIIGGGITGASLAYFLAKKGHQVSIYENSSQIGGVTSSIILDGMVVDSFYHVLTGGENPLRLLIRDIGLEDAVYPIKLTQGFFREGRLYPATTMKELLFFQALNLVDRIRLGLTVLQALSIQDWRNLDKQTAREWLVNIGGEALYEGFWRPIMYSKFGVDAERVVATDMWFRIRRLGEVTVFGKGGGPCYLKGTLRVLFVTLEEKLRSMGVQIHLNAPVRRINTIGDEVRSIEIGNSHHVVDVERVVSSVPVAALAGLLPESLSQYQAVLNSIEYLSNISLILKTKHPITPFYQLNLGDYKIPFTGVVNGECFYPREEYGGYVTYIPRYFRGQESLFELTATELLDQYMPFLVNICPEFCDDWVINLAVSRTHFADIVRPVGFGNIIPSLETPIKNLYLLSPTQIYPDATILDSAVLLAQNLAMQLS